MKKLLLCAAWLVSIGNIAYADETIIEQSTSARVRFFGQAVIGLTFYKNKSCYGGSGISASKTGLGGVFGNKKNISIGMPGTPNSVNLNDRNGFLAAAFYREYSVKAGEPLAILGTYAESTGRTTYSCNNIGKSFVPKSGGDYEVSMDLNGQTCELKITEIDAQESTIQLKPVEVATAYTCKD